MQQFINSAPFVQYSFNTKEDADAALLKLPFIHLAKDSNNLT
jgi:hypothetical protein